MGNYRKNGTIFVAYKGREFNEKDITSRLNQDCPPAFEVKTETDESVGLIMAKVVYSTYSEDREPLWSSLDDIISVSGYNQTELDKASHMLPGYIKNDPNKGHTLFTSLYKYYGTKMYEKLEKCGMHFCSVIWDDENEEFVAGISESKGEYSNLYYGYTKQNKELMFSNSLSVLKVFCKEVNEMKPNTYMSNGEIYNLDGSKVKAETSSLIKNTRENADHLLEGFNSLFGFVAKEAVTETIRANLDEYLASDDPKKKLTDYIVKELDSATQKEVLEIIKKTIDEYGVEQNISENLKDLFDTILEEYKKSINVPVTYNIYLNGNQIGKTKGGFYHEKYESILRDTQIDEPIMLIGPAGSGKNVAVSQVAEALGLKMYYTNNASNEFKLTGFIDAGGNYRDTEFYKAFKNGGLFFLDEIDNSDPSALIVINSALANGYMAFPHETIDRHPDFRIIAAANTFGKGADLQYVGRNALDAATLDRFDNIFFDYDRKLEECLYPNEEVLNFMWSFRDAVFETKIPHVVSTRGIGKVYKKEINGIPVEEILTANVVKNLGQDDVNTIIGNMNNISSSNKYYSGIKSLVLRR